MAKEEGVPPSKELAEKYSKYANKNDFKTFFLYVEANKKFETDKEFQDKVSKYIYEAEKGDIDKLHKLRETAEFGLSGQREILERCGFSYDEFVFESKFIENGSVWKIVDSLKSNGRLMKLDNGATAIDLREFGSPKEATVIMRPDGTTVYILRDVAYHIEKVEQGDVIITILGEDHKVEFIELKAILNLLGKNTDKLEAVHYSFVSLESGKMSTRKGEIISLDEVLDEGISRALDVIKEKNPDLENKKEVAEAVAVGALKYSLIKLDPMKHITFRWEDALDFEGDTAPYIQYAHARARSILRKAGNFDLGGKPINDDEWKLFMKVIDFSEVVNSAADGRKPSLVANYLYLLAKEFNEFYHSNKVINSENQDFRLFLVKMVADALKEGLNLIGTDAPDEM